MTRAAAKARGSGPAFPFPFLGSGSLPHDEVARLVIWFSDVPTEQARADVLAELPPHFQAFALDGIRAQMFETHEDLWEVFDSDEKRAELDRAIGTALVRVHARYPIVFAARVALIEYDDDTEVHVPDAWHAWSVKQAARILDVIEADPEVPAGVIATALGGHLDHKAEARARAHLLARLQPTIASTAATSEDIELFSELLIDAPASERAKLVAPLPPAMRLRLAVEANALLGDFVDAPDAMAVLEHLADTRTDDAWTDDSATAVASTNARRVRDLVDLLTSVAIKDEGRRDIALRLAETAITAANDLAPASPAWVASRLLAIKSLAGDLDAALPHLEVAITDKEVAKHAVGTALAQATKLSHRPMIDACVDLVRRDPAFASDRIIMANLIGNLVGNSHHAEATQIALMYLELERDPDTGTWSRHALTPALVTNVVYAFAHTNERGKLASAFLAHATDLAERAGGAYFVDELPSDIRGSAHAWIGLWHLAGGDIDEAARRFRYARDAGYSDLALMRNDQLVHPHLSNPAIVDIFAGEEDAAISEKTRQMKANPRDWWATFSRGLLYHEKGDIPRALADYTRTLELNPDYPDVYINIGNIHWTRDSNHAEAIRWYDKALARADKSFLGRLNRSEARLHTKDHAGTIEDAKVALTVQPSAHAHFLIALAHAALGDTAAARKAARAGAKLAPDIASIDVPAWKDTIRALL